MWSIGCALLIFAEQNLITNSMKYNTVGSVMLIMYLLIPFGYFLDWLVVGQQFEGLELVGAAIICLTNIVINWLRLKGYIE